MKNLLIPCRSIKLSLDPLLSYQREDSLYFLNRQWKSHFFGCLKKGALIQNSCVRSFAGCADLNLAGLLCIVPQVQWRRQWRFSLANQWSAEFTCHILVTVRLAWNLGRGDTKKKYLYPVKKNPKVSHTEPHHAVPCSGKTTKQATKLTGFGLSASYRVNQYLLLVEKSP